MNQRIWDGGAPPAGCIDVFRHAALWVVGLARELDRGRSESDVSGLILYGGEISALRVPLPDIFASMAGHDGVDPWIIREAAFYGQAVCRIMVSDASLRGHYIRPGEPLPDGLLHHVQFRSGPQWLPFADIILGLDRMAAAADVPPRELQFQFRGQPLLDGQAMLDAIRANAREQDEFKAELDRWRDRTVKRIPASAINPPMDDGGEDWVSPIPPSLRGKLLPRADIARYVNRTDRQIRRWDGMGRVPTGRKWVKGTPTRLGTVVYDIEKNWPAMVSMRRRDRNEQNDRL